MSELDLSFAAKESELDPVAVTGNKVGLNLSFATKDPEQAPKPSDLAAAIVADREAGNFPQKAEGAISKAVDFFTGSARETRATEELPEIGSEIGIRALLGEDASLGDAAALLTTTNPAEMVKILQGITNKPISIRPDEAGNIILGVDGREAIINKPGFSKLDLMQLTGLGAAFFPSAKFANGAQTVKGAFLKGGISGGATQTGIETGQKAKGGDFDKTDVAVAAAGAGASELLLPLAGSVGRFVKDRLTGGQITPELVTEARQFAVEAGVDAELISQLNERTLVDLAARADDALGEAGEFGISLTRGQQTGNPAQLSLEDRFRSGSMGERPQSTMLDFEQAQNQQINAARDSVAESLGGEQLTRQQAGAAVRQDLLNAEATAAQAVSGAYEGVGDAAISPEGVSNILKATRNSVRAVEFDKTLSQTAKVLEQVKSFEGVIKTFEGKGLRPVDINRIEQMRRRLNTAIGAADNASDRRQVTIMKRAFDDGLDKAIDDALFSGDQEAIDALKSARGLFAEYAQSFRANPGKTRSGRSIPDKAGEFIERVIESNPTDEQVINALLGASNINNSSGAIMARRFREVLGADSQGWQAIRQEAFRRIIKTNRVNGEEIISAQKSIKALDEAIDKSGSLMRELYSPEELTLIRRFVGAVKRTQPDLVRSRENPSGTSQAMIKSISDRLGSALALSGDLTLALTAKGVSTGSGFRSSSQAKSAVRPFSPLKLEAPLSTSSITASASSASQADVLPSSRSSDESPQDK